MHCAQYNVSAVQAFPLPPSPAAALNVSVSTVAAPNRCDKHFCVLQNAVVVTVFTSTDDTSDVARKDAVALHFVCFDVIVCFEHCRCRRLSIIHSFW